MEEETKITTPKREKDPSWVEMGKRLGAISKEARERKARMRQLESVMSYSGVAAIVIAAVGVLSYHYYFRSTPGDTTPPHTVEEKEEIPKKENKVPRLETF